MTLEEYQERAAALEVDRGALAAGFTHEDRNLNYKPRHSVDWDRPAGYNAGSLGIPLEDLSHLNPRQSSRCAQTGRVGVEVREAKRLRHGQR